MLWDSREMLYVFVIKIYEQPVIYYLCEFLNREIWINGDNSSYSSQGVQTSLKAPMSQDVFDDNFPARTGREVWVVISRLQAGILVQWPIQALLPSFWRKTKKSFFFISRTTEKKILVETVFLRR